MTKRTKAKRATKKRSKKSSAKPESDKLTPKQELFVNEYVISLNGTRAAMAAKYSKKENSAAAQACELLRIPKILKRINEVRAERNLTFKRDQGAILADILAIKDRAMADNDERVALKALDLESKHGGHLTEKRELSNPDGSLKPRVTITLPDNGRNRKR